jgi:hypothetical protein
VLSLPPPPLPPGPFPVASQLVLLEVLYFSGLIWTLNFEGEVVFSLGYKEMDDYWVSISQTVVGTLLVLNKIF